MSSETDLPAEPTVLETVGELLFAPSAAPGDDNEICIRTQKEGDYAGDQVRRDTSISSALFKMLSTMIGGGLLSLPLAFQQSGNSLLGPLMLITMAFITDFCFRLLVASANHLNPPHQHRLGNNSVESVTSAAFGPKAYVFCMALVVSMCLFMAVGWCVLLRDMVEPITDLIPRQHVPSEWLHKNLALFTVMLLVTPLCTLRTVTALKGFSGAASMISILILGFCIVFRSIQCNIDAPEPFYKYLTFFPENSRELLDSIPIYVQMFVCNFNILPVHNELQHPTPKRVSWWLRSTAWFAFLFYLFTAFIGSAYGHCTATGRVQGNILLDFDKDDPLLLVGRMCMAFTITIAFPMVVIPARDIILRAVIFVFCLEPPVKEEVTMLEAIIDEPLAKEGEFETTQALKETLVEAIDETLEEGERERRTPSEESSPRTEQSATTGPQNTSFLLRLLTAIAIFWTAGGVASGVGSIYIVWALSGSSLSILLSQLIPCGCYLVITKDREGDVASKWLAWLLILVFTPLMFLLTANAVNNAFFN